MLVLSHQLSTLSKFWMNSSLQSEACTQACLSIVGIQRMRIRGLKKKMAREVIVISFSHIYAVNAQYTLQSKSRYLTSWPAW